MNRQEIVSRVRQRQEPWDLVIIGGGATGVGVAVDAASRGYDALLLEQSDFGKGTSSRSTKLIHGGVRYLQQGNISLVMEALKERGVLRENAPHLVHDLRFIVPNYDWWEGPFYGIGLKIYDRLAGKYGFGRSKRLSKEMTVRAIPTLNTDGLRGGVQYYDGQFDDARLLINLAQTAAQQGAAMLNYAVVDDLLKDGDGCVTGVCARDLESGEALELGAKCVINATGPFCDHLRKLDDGDAPRLIAPSQGVHLVFDKSFLPGDSAIMVPRTRDGRVMFAIPWHDHVLVGTTDTPVQEIPLEPIPKQDEIEFLLGTASQYLAKAPSRRDVLSTFAGIRPLVRSGNDQNTATLSRDHTIHISRSGLLTITGGKWTTYRSMAEDCVNQAAVLAKLEDRPCVTRQLKVHGFHRKPEEFGDLHFYGDDAPAIADLIASDPNHGQLLHDGLPHRAGQVVWAARFEMARTVDDFLSRRTRATVLNVRAAVTMAPAVARILAQELGRSSDWVSDQVAQYESIASGYMIDRP
jgi:glycerol-3-phosphate dehydrogenase